MSTLALRRPKLDIPVFAQRDGTVRLGWRPERSFVVAPPAELPSDVLLDLLRRLDGVHSRAHMIWYAGTVGLSANAMSTLLAELGELGLLSEGGDKALQDHDFRRPVVVSSVRVLGRGPIGDAVMAGLTSSATLLVERVADTHARTGEVDASLSVCDLVVLCDDMTPDPRVVTALVRTRTPHLQVRLRDGQGVVGPFVLPGVSSCLRCADLMRCGLDPQWPHLSAQLLGRVGEASRPTVLATAALALAQIDAFVDGRRAPLTDTTVEVDLSTHAMTRRTWSIHPHCDCTLS